MSLMYRTIHFKDWEKKKRNIYWNMPIHKKYVHIMLTLCLILRTKFFPVQKIFGLLSGLLCAFWDVDRMEFFLKLCNTG